MNETRIKLSRRNGTRQIGLGEQGPSTRNGPHVRLSRGKFNVNVDLFLQRLALVRIVYELPDSVMEHAKKYIDSFHKFRSNHGEFQAVNHYKSLANYVKKSLLGDQPEPPPFSKCKNNRPTVLKPLDDIYSLERPGAREFAQTVSLFYLIQGEHEAPVDTSSIDGPQDDVDTHIIHEFRKYLYTDPLRIHKRSLVDLKPSAKLRITGAQGIHGQSFYSIPLERQSLRKSPLRDSLLEMYTLTGRTFISDLLLDEEYQNKVPERPPYLRRLSILREPGNKLRYITIGDFFSQNALLPIHEDVMRILRCVPEDATYASSEACDFLANLSTKRQKRKYFCFDLKNFTDYLPLSLQREVVTFLYGDKLAECWSRIMREPILHGWKDGQPAYINFTRGQPMGLLSSWAVASLTHHLLVRWANFRERNVSRVTYRLLGDDIVIWGTTASRAYEKLFNQLKIPISKEKTIQSPRGFEFCKRRFLDGVEVTPAPVKSLVDENWTYAAYELLRTGRISSPLAVMQVDMFLGQLDPSVHKWERSVQLFTVWNALHFYRMQPAQKGTDYTWGRARFQSLLVNAHRRHIESRLKELGPALQRVLEFQPHKIPVPLLVNRRRIRVRGVMDRTTSLIYSLVACQWGLKILDLMTQVEENPAVEASHGWTVLVDLSLLDLDFYVLDPQKRWAPRRQKEVISQLSTIVGVLNDEKRANQALTDNVRAYDLGIHTIETVDIPNALSDEPGWQGVILSHSLALQERLRVESEPYDYGEDLVEFLCGERELRIGAVRDDD